MHRRHKHDIIVFLSLFAGGVSLYLAITHYMGYAVPCDITHGCEDVLNSKYSSVFGIPLSVLGVVYYIGIIGAALLANHYSIWRKLLAFLLGVGAIGALVFLFIQIFILHRICQYCLAVDFTTIILFLWDLNIEHRQTANIEKIL